MTDLLNQILYKEESYLIQGAVFEVYREMGCGFLEAVYQECLEKETNAELLMAYSSYKAEQEIQKEYDDTNFIKT